VAQRVVFDCMLFLQAAARPAGPAAACLELAVEGAVELVISPEVHAEIRDVMTRPKVRSKFPSLTDDRVTEFLNAIGRAAITLNPVPAVFALPRDPKDEKYINLAAYAGAKFLVTRDNDLLDLNSAESLEGKTLREGRPMLVITDPVSFLRKIRLPSDPEQPNTNDSAPKISLPAKPLDDRNTD
jgi:putative PIN family toxin of toxin-antitoxin system